MTVDEVLAWLAKRASRRNAAGMARFGIRSRRAFGVSMGAMRPLAKRLGKNHALALALWDSGWHEGRILAALIGDPARVTRRQMNTWAAAFESWADCDGACIHLFSRTPYAWAQARQWARWPRELVKRAGFALMAALVSRDKQAPDRRFLALLPHIAQGARDERNLVKKAVSWALRSIGKRNRALNGEAIRLARRLGGSRNPACRWVGKDALRELAGAKVQARLRKQVRRRGAAAR